MTTTWAFTVAGLYYIWPLEPRITISDGWQFQNIGISPDSRHLFSLTRRAVNSDETSCYYAVSSGPLQRLDLNSGECRVINLPYQNNSPESARTFQGWDAAVDADGWILKSLTVALTGKRYRLIQMNRIGERFAVEIDIDQGVVANCNQLPNAPIPLDLTKMERSPQGHWIADLVRDGAPTGSSKQSLRLIDCTTGLVVKEFAPSPEYAVCFSEDDFLVAVSNGFDERGTTTIWGLNPFVPLQSIDVSSPCMRFSPSNRQIAIRQEDGRVVVFDVETAAALHDFPMHGQIKAIRFASDESHLFGYNYVCGSLSSSAIDHHRISAIQIWNLANDRYLGTHTPKNSRAAHLFPDGCVDTLTQVTIRDGCHLIDVKTGEVTVAIPDDTDVEVKASANNSVAVDLPAGVQSNELLAFLLGWIPLPISSSTNEVYSTLRVSDSRSGWKSPDLPRDNYCVGPGTLFLSPDRQTLVTTSNWNSPVIKVWDLNAPKPWFKILGWSLVVPSCLLLWNCRRRRKTDELPGPAAYDAEEPKCLVKSHSRFRKVTSISCLRD